MRISDWSSDVCSSDLANCVACHQANGKGIPGTFPALDGDEKYVLGPMKDQILTVLNGHPGTAMAAFRDQLNDVEIAAVITYTRNAWRSEEHTSELQSLMRISYAVFCLKKTTNKIKN